VDRNAVREQYEAYPYPERDPEAEKERLLSTWPEQLAQINHYCFRGRRDFRSGFRVLIAGGGTGDATIYLAEQLRDTDAQLVYLDWSGASLAIAQRRAQIRKLANIRFVHGSLLELPALGLGRFDYISCTGVLHHLDDPEMGLESLLSVLDTDGALNILVYGRYGRAAVYQLQDLMKIINGDGADMRQKLERAKAVLASLPPTNAWTRHRLNRDPGSMQEAEIYDLFLHAQDRAYTVPELYEWFGTRAGLHLQFSRLNIGRIGYQPQGYIRAPALLEIVSRLPPAEQAAVAELVAGDMDLHSFFATRSADAAASLEELDNVPFFYGGFELNRGPELAAWMEKNPGRVAELKDARSGLVGWVVPGKYTRELLRQLDGERSLREVFGGARASEPALAGVTDAELLNDFRAVYEVFNAVDGMLLRHRSVPKFPTTAELTQLAYRWQQLPQDMPRTRPS